VKEDNRILMISDSSYDTSDVFSHLKSRGINLKLSRDPEIAMQIFKQYEPEVLLLNFHTVELAKAYYLNLLKGEKSDKTVLHQTILLCTVKEAKKAAELAIERLIDDYFIFKPIHDPNRLPFVYSTRSIEGSPKSHSVLSLTKCLKTRLSPIRKISYMRTDKEV